MIPLSKLLLGQTVMTAGVADFIEENNIPLPEVNQLFYRHSNGDWGDMPKEDKKENDSALLLGNRVVSSYSLGGETVWIITEADRSVTTLLFPREY